MTTRVRTIEFLPEIFKTKTNEQFLSATLDQLVQQPNFKRVQGFIGSKFGYGVSSGDAYLVEPDQQRSDYQLEPSVVFKKKDTEIAVDILTYTGLLDSIKLEGGVTDNNNSLFSNQFYSWDSFVDLDKFINYNRYYWLPTGPDAITLSTTSIYSNATYTVSSQSNAYKLAENLVDIEGANPILTLVRGGTYYFEVSQTSKFWIQTQPGVSGTDASQDNISTREIFGLTNNGINLGTLTFNVPAATDQDPYLVAGNTNIDLVSFLPFDQVNGRRLRDIANIDGIADLNGKTLLFSGLPAGTQGYISQFFDTISFDNPNTSVGDFEEGVYTDINSHYYTITLVGDPAEPVIKLAEAGSLVTDQKITVTFGEQYISRNFVRNSLGQVNLVPIQTAKLDTLYYQDQSNPLKVGKIKIVDTAGDSNINVFDIIGKKTYTSPNKVTLSNGMKIQFLGNVTPQTYNKKQFYVEGVGTSIVLVPVDEQNVPEDFGTSFVTPFDEGPYDQFMYGSASEVPGDPDYITINRSSISQNAWSRSNRWFHEDILKTTIEKCIAAPIASAALGSSTSRAKRPVIEFYPNLKLFNSGTVGKRPIDFVDFTTTDAFNTVANQTSFSPDGASSSLFDGARVIFANDKNSEVRRKIYVVNFAKITGQLNPVITLSVAPDGDTQVDEQTVVLKGENYIGRTIHYNGTAWVLSQYKESVNQPPKFDVFNKSGVSFGDKTYYPGSDFDGCTLFEYAVGTGTNDPILGFPIKYSSISNLGDISFTATLNNQEFHYVDGLTSITSSVSEGFVYNYSDRTNYNREIGWQTAIEKSFQYQVFSFDYGASSSFTCDVAAIAKTDTAWNPVVVYVNNNRTLNFTYTTTDTTTTVTITDTLAAGDAVNVMLYSLQTSKVAYFQIPTNLDHNPFNEQITNINLGDIRGHYKSICNNAPNLVGSAFGSNNYRDLGNLIPYGTRIIQNSAPITSAAAFLRSRRNNFFDALTFNSREYIKYKVLLLDTINRLDFNILQDNASILDEALNEISSSKIDSNPFFWSDMIPSGNADTVNSYSFKIGINSSVFPLTRIYSFTTANYHSVLVYLTRRINNIARTMLLVKDDDYVVSATEKSVTVNTDLLPGDIITVKEYNQTYGSYIPSTPSKLGMYPAFKPEVVLDESYINPTYFIKGHDGSYNRLFGEYNDGYLQDFRDRALIEFETRIYNNIKVNAKIPVEYDDVFPGQFRATQYSYDDVQQMYTTSFLNWVGLNRVNYQSQFYIPENEFTWNYSKCTSKLDRKKTLPGNWKGAFIWMYDTPTPHTTPWEMLGLMNKPTWWDARYGEAPYTSENILLWTDISEGRIWNDGDEYINDKRIRKGLLSVLPVDETGKLLSPFSTIVSGYDRTTFKNEWAVGDVGPTELSYLKSSSWPFDFMRLAALTKPASFFTLGLDLDTYKYNNEFNQYLVNGRTRKITNSVIYGTNSDSASHSYLNWLVDYERQFGVGGSSSIYDVLQSLDVRLSYRLAGFSDKDMLKFYVEKGSPNSKNSSLLIPDESYNVLLYENQPHDVVTFSSVILQKTATGYKVYGNSQNKAYFTALIPISNGNVETITVNTMSVAVGKNYSDNSYIVPYGTEFTTVSGLCEFVKGYGQYLERQGVVFNDIENSLELNWNQMIAEMLYWIQSGWEVGSTINVNPSANQITVDKDSHVVQPLTIQNQNFVLNQNLIPIQLKDMGIYRNGTTFSAKALNAGDSISFFTARLSNIEHVIVFDNSTVFNDSIFNLITGLRQQRLYVKGAKSAEWNGTMDAAGFIINQDNITDWVENEKYTKGSIVKYKNAYWVARDGAIPPSDKFDTSLWIKTDYTDIQKGLLPNPSTRAYESTLYYDANKANLEQDSDLLSFSLVGYRPRDYLVQGDLDDITQVNIYKQMISTKGTNQSLTNLNGINLQNNELNYNVHENWAIKTGEFGGVLKQNFVEFTLDQSQLTGNPSVVSLVGSEGVDGAQQLVGLSQLKNYGRSVTSTDILPVVTGYQPEILQSAGYVNLEDVVTTGYNVDRLDDAIIGDVYKNDYIWVADNDNNWDVYTPVSMEILLKLVYNNLNGTLIFTFNKDHNLSEKDPIGILNFDERINGFYRVESVLDTRSILVNGTLDATINLLESVGLPYKLYSQRVAAARDIVDLPILANEYSNSTVWVDNSDKGDWTVYQKKLNYFNSGFSQIVNKSEYGAAVAYIPNIGYFITDPGQGKMYQYRYVGSTYTLINTFDASSLGITATRYGTEIAYNNDYLIVSASNVDLNGSGSSYVFFYRIVHATSVQSIVLEQLEEYGAEYGRVGQSMTLSGNSEIAYVTLADYGWVLPYHLDADYIFDNVKTFTATSATLAAQVPVDTVNYAAQSYVDVTGNVVASFSQGTNAVIDFGVAGESGETVYVVSTAVYSAVPNTTRITFTTTISDASFMNVIPSGTKLYKVNAMRLSDAVAVGDKSFKVSGDWSTNTLVPAGKFVSFTSTDVTTPVYTIITTKYDSTTSKTTFFVAEAINTTVASGTLVSSASAHFSSVEYYNNYLGVAPDPNTGNPVSITLYATTVVGASSIKLTGDYTWLTPNGFIILNNGVTSVTLTTVGFTYNGTYTTVTIVGTIATAYSTSTGVVLVNDETLLLSNGTATSDVDGFGYSLATDNSGSILFAGAPYTDLSNSVQDTGAVLMFNRAVASWEIQVDGRIGQFGVFILPWSPIALRKFDSVYVNGKRLNSVAYVRVLNAVLVEGSHLSAGDTVTYISCDYVYAGQLLSYTDSSQAKAGEQFGFSIACNTYGSEVLVGCPYDRHASPDKEGAVYRFTHEGKRFGTVTGTSLATNPDVTYVMINGYAVRLAAGSAASVASTINQANITNVVAEVSDSGFLTIRLRDVSLNPVNNRLTVTTFVKSGVDGYAFGKPYSEYFGLTPYTRTQVIVDPHVQDRARFGYEIKFNPYGSFVVSAPVSDRYLGTTFDFTNDSNSHNDAVFDNNLTEWEDRFADAGSVYMFDYLNTYNESLTNIGKFVYAQACNDLVSDYGSMPEYGTALTFNEYTVVIGTPKFKPNDVGGKVVVYENSANSQDWTVYRQAANIVNIDKVQKVQFYDNTDDTSIESLDYIDPLQGKLLGVVRENIDYISSKDPAGYNNNANSKGNRTWNKLQLGKIWFDTTAARFLHYHQNDVVYDSKHWGTTFPGSDVAVYTWIESDVTPSNYVGLGTPYDLTKYAVAYHNDASSNSVPKYYFWVRNTNSLGVGKTITDSVLEQYIAAPQSSGIAFMAPLKPNTFALYNASEYIKGKTTNMHLGYSLATGDANLHTQYKLIRTNYPDDFIPGLPDKQKGYLTPDGLYDRMLDSLAGSDERGSVVPDPSLPKMVQTGISTRPRQSFFFNRFDALKNYLGYANTVLISYPITEIENITFLTASSSDFDTSKYWDYVYWWATGYSNTTRSSFDVPVYSDLLSLTPYEGLIVGVTTNSQNKREVYAYLSGKWTRIGLANGTIQFNSSLWDYGTNKIGFGDNFFDSVNYDMYPSMETRYIIRALNEQIYVGPLFEHRNKSLILLLEYIESENIANNNHMPWLNKTSLVDVSYNVRELLPYQKYQRDNQTFLEGYVNEVKPYHVVIKDFFLKYSGTDTFVGDITDFDLPPKYNETVGRFVSPQLVNKTVYNAYQHLPTSTIWKDSDYALWLANFGLTFEKTDNTPVATLASYVTSTGINLVVTNPRGLPVQGIVRIDDELISYTDIDRMTGQLLGVSRAVNGTTNAEHLQDATVFMDLPEIVVLDAGRGYSEIPTVKAYIDTSIYPAPIREAVFKAVTSSDKVISIETIDPGEGYAITPEIIVDYSISTTFVASQATVNATARTIALNSIDFNTGEIVKFATSDNNNGIIDDGFYYICVLSNPSATTSVVSLHTTYESALSGEHPVKINASLIDSGYTYTVGITVRAVPTMKNTRTRGFVNTLRFDRTSYNTRIVEWSPNQFWSSPYVASTAKSSASDLIYSTTSLASAIGTVLPVVSSTTINSQVVVTLDYSVSQLQPGQVKGLLMYFYKVYSAVRYTDTKGAVFDIYRPRFNPYSVSSEYAYRLITPGTGYNDGDTITIRGDYTDGNGHSLGGVQYTNDVKITIKFVDNSGGAYITTIAGTPVVTWNKYYLNPINSTQLAVYADAAFRIPVTGSFSFTTSGTDYAYIPEPLQAGPGYQSLTSSLVSYNGKIWRCIASNNDSTFDYNKWEYVPTDDRSINALDRIAAFYEPTLDIPGKDITQLVKNVTYPNNIYFGNSFADEDVLPIDYVVKDTPYYPRNLNMRSIEYKSLTPTTGIFYAVADAPDDDDSIVMVSTDAVNWTQLPITSTIVNMNEIFYDGEAFFISANHDTSPMFVSYDGQTWATLGEPVVFDNVPWDFSNFSSSDVTVPRIPLQNVYGVQHHTFAVGDSILRSDNSGASWTEVFSFNSQLTNTLRQITYLSSNNFDALIAVGGGQIITAGAGTSNPTFGYTSRILTSTDQGNTWNILPSISTNQLYFVTASSSLVVIGGENGSLWTSVNGANWTPATISGAAVTRTLRSGAYGNNRFVIVGDAGTLLVSTDGVTWTQSTDSLITTKDLYKVKYLNNKFYAVGDTDTIMTSTDGHVWVNQVNLEIVNPDYTIKGSDFLYGYGPEELVAGVITDNLSMQVKTLPGAYWDNDIISQSVWYGHTGFAMNATTVKPSSTVVSFDGLVLNPAQISVYIVTDTTGVARRIYESTSSANPTYYTVQWAAKTITLQGTALAGTESLMIEAYEVGNGRQIARSNNQLTPLQVDPDTGHSMFVVNAKFDNIANNPIVFVDGVQKTYNTDYVVLPYKLAGSSTSIYKILFNTTYTDSNYVSFALMATTATKYTTTQYGYTIPLTQIFPGNTAVLAVTNTIDASSSSHIIVEYNGSRLRPGTDYTISGQNITMVGSYTSTGLLAVTTYHDGQRQYFATSTSTTLKTTAVTAISTSGKVTLTTAADPGFANGDLVRIDGIVGSTELNNNTYYVKRETATTYTLYTNVGLTTLASTSITAYVSGGFMWKDSLTYVATPPTVDSSMPVLTYTDSSRVWVTVNGKRVPNSKLRFGTGNKLNIMVTIAAGDVVLVTAMVSGSTPTETQYNVSVDKSGATEIYRSNQCDGTWLTQALLPTDTTIYLKDASKVIKRTTQTVTVASSNGTLYAYVDCVYSEAFMFSVYNNTTSATVGSSNYKLKVINDKPAVVFTSGVTSGNSVTVTLRYGNVIEVNGERIKFQNIDLATNQLTGLSRGTQRTPVMNQAKYTMVYAINSYTKLPDIYQAVNWNTKAYYYKGDPLQMSTTAAATFLNTVII